MGAHVWWPWFLKEHWFGQFRLSGWSPDWYAGFPVGQYYFPLPAVLVALLDLIPFVLVQRRVQARHRRPAPLLLPAAAYSFAQGPARAVARTARLRGRGDSGCSCRRADNWQIYGGNIASTLAGEFSFTLALALGLFALGALGQDARHRPSDRGCPRC